MDEKDTKKNTTQGKGKNKNKKQTTMNLNDFQAAAQPQAGFTAVSIKWSEFCNDDDEDSSNYGIKDKEIILPTAPKSIRGPDIDINQVTYEPPFICYLSNLPFEASEDDIHKFFKDLKITHVDLTRDPGASGRARGQGSCEFPDRKTLIDAFTFNNETIKNRPIKLSLNSHETEREYNRRERDGDKEDRTAGDWRSGPKTERPANYSSNFQSNRSDSNYFGNNRNRNYESRNNYGANDSFGDNMNNNRNYNQNNRQLNRMDRNYNSNNNYQNNLGDSNRYPPSNDSQLQRSDEPPKERPKLYLEKRTLPISNHQPLPQPPQYHSHQDNQYQVNAPPQRTSESETKSIEPEKPVERKRLILKPKTKKDDDNSSVQAPKANPSIFGEAKPVDTTKRLLEIEIKKKQELEQQEKLLEDSKLEKELVEKFEKPARDFNNQRGISREYNKQRSSESSSHHGDNSRPQYRENRNDFSHDNNRNSNRFNDGYRKQQQGGSGNLRRMNQTGNRNYNNDNYPNNNRDFNRENNNRDNYSSRDNQRGNKLNNNRNNWNNDHMDNSKNRQPHDQSYDERSNRQGGNRRDRGNEGFNPPMNKFDLLKDEMD